MKRLLLLSIFCAISAPIFSQNWSLGTRWVYDQWDYMPDNVDEYRVFIKVADTLVQGRSCSVVKERYLANSATSPVDFFIFDHILWQQGAEVWFYHPYSEQFYPLYDFSKNQGDTLQTTGFNPHSTPESVEPFRVRVDSVSYLPNGGQPLKVQWVSYINSGAAYTFVMAGAIIEHIGWMRYLFPQSGVVDPPPGGSFVCFQDSLLSYPEGMVCGPIVSTSGPAPAVEVKVFPNPATDWLDVEAENVQQIRLFDTCGALVAAQSGSNRVFLGGLPIGVYTVAITVKGGVMYKKMVKI